MNFLLILNFKLRESSSYVYKNVTGFDGYKISGSQLVQLMNQFGAVLLKDENGQGIIMSHGNPDGSMKIDLSNMVSQLGMTGNWILVSCYNEMRQDYNNIGVSIIREPHTISVDAIAFTIIDNDLWVSIDPELVKLSKIVGRIDF